MESCCVTVGGSSSRKGGSFSVNIAMSILEAIHHGMGAGILLNIALIPKKAAEPQCTHLREREREWCPWHPR